MHRSSALRTKEAFRRDADWSNPPLWVRRVMIPPKESVHVSSEPGPQNFAGSR